MAHVVELTPRAEREYARLHLPVKTAILRVMRRLEAEPRFAGTDRVVGLPGARRARVGGYRIIFTIDDRRRVVRVLRIAPRDKAYKRLRSLRLE